MAQFSFDASTVSPKSSIAPLPAGVYLAHITESDVVPLKTGNGSSLKLTFEVIDGQSKGRKVWARLNIQHTNPEAQRIAQSDLSAICHATNNIKLMDTSSLHFKPLKIKVVIKPAAGGYEESNDIKGYEAASGAKPAAFVAPSTPAANAPEATPAAAAPAAAPTSNTPAWARKAA